MDGKKNVLWYNNSARAAGREPAILGPEVGYEPSERVYPVMIRDAQGRLFVSFRDHATGESKLSVIEPDAPRFSSPITIAPALNPRLRWNAHLVSAPTGGLYLVWDHDHRVYLRHVAP